MDIYAITKSLQWIQEYIYIYIYTYTYTYTYIYHTTWRILAPWSEIKPMSPTVEEQSINHWTPGEVPNSRTHWFKRMKLKKLFIVYSCMVYSHPLNLNLRCQFCGDVFIWYNSYVSPPKYTILSIVLDRLEPEP